MDDASSSDHAARERELERQARLYSALSQINQAIVRVSSREELFREIPRILVDAGRFAMAWIGWIEPATREILAVGDAGDESGYLRKIRIFADDRPEGQGPTGTAIRENRTYVANDFFADPRTLPWRDAAAGSRWRASASLPIRFSGRPCGALTTYAHDIGFFQAKEVELLEQAALDISFALENLDRETRRREAEAERRALEEKLHASQKMESIGLLAGGVAHDFNNLLTVITGNAEILLSDLPEGSPAALPTREILKAAERASSLTSQLLSFSRRQVLNPRVLDPNVVLRETETMLRRLLGEDIEVTLDLARDVRPVRVDPGQLGQVLINLAVNARDAMPTGGTLRIETRTVDADGPAPRFGGPTAGRFVRITVTDTGCGMSPELLSHAFEPFFTTKGAGKGTGLGLAVVHGIVEQSGGHVEVESRIGHGTSFRIDLPASSDPVDEPAPRIPATAAGGCETVFVVEDDEGVRRLAVAALRSAGYAVLEGHDGEDALRTLGEHGPRLDLLVTDVVMPVMGGRDLAEALARRQPGLRVLFTSGYMDDAVVRHGVQHDDVHFLQKPYTPAALRAKVREVLDASRPRSLDRPFAGAAV